MIITTIIMFRRITRALRTGKSNSLDELEILKFANFISNKLFYFWVCADFTDILIVHPIAVDIMYVV